MVSYSTNCMGPYSLRWYTENGFTGDPVTKWSEFLQREYKSVPILKHWAGGRIDVYGTGEMYNPEIGLPIMEASHWNRFSEWLKTYKTEEQKTLDEILNAYYKDDNPEIEWFDEKENQNDS